MEKFVFFKCFILIRIAALLTSGWAIIPTVQAAQPGDDFIEGYATAMSP